MNWSRRRLLQAGGAFAAISAATVVSAATSEAAAELRAPVATDATVKRISLQNLHTSEQLDVEFARADGYVPDALTAIQTLLRDFRNNEQHAIDPRLMDYLYDVAEHIGVEPKFSVISGYRSPQTNEQLRERSSGVASHSLHMEGRAIDVRLAGVDCAALANRALELTRGGVGYYRQSNFVHLDTGRFRTWKG